jgi:hypothetical protein
VLSLAQAKKVAAAAVLLPRDLPGYRARANTRDKDDAAAELFLARCMGRPSTSYLFRNPGRVFASQRTEVYSSADVVRTAAAARAEIVALKSAKGRGCVEALLTDALRRVGAGRPTVEAKPVPLSVPDSDADVAYFIEARGTKGGREVRLAYLMMASVVGQTQVSVEVGLGDRLVTLQDANVLLIAAVARARELTT